MITVIMPVYNEEKAATDSLRELHSAMLKDFPGHEIIVVDDGSTDNTREKIRSLDIHDLKVIEHIENLGYGKSLFDGILAARYDCIAIIDGDGSYPAHRIKDLYSYFPKYDMVVGARQGREYRRGIFKRPARALFTYLAEYSSGRKIPDVNSGFRIFKKDVVMKFQDSLCTGFSFTTTLTLIFLLNHYRIKYIPIEYSRRKGESKIRYFKDTLRAGQIIVETILYYNPIKLFMLIAFLNLIFGLMLHILSYFVGDMRFLSIAAAFCIASFIPICAIGLIADQLKKIYNRNKE